jgi:hypothetical protein
VGVRSQKRQSVLLPTQTQGFDGNNKDGRKSQLLAMEKPDAD